MTIRITLKDRQHPFVAVDRWMREMARDLQGRWSGQLVSQLLQWAEQHRAEMLTPAGQQMFARLAQSMIEQQTWGIADDNAYRVYVYGVQVARLGEMALTKQPTADAVAQAVAGNTYIDRQAMQFARAYTFNEIQSKDRDVVSLFQSRLLQTLDRGEHPSKAARQLSSDLDDDRADWMRIARTETARALQAGLFDETRRLEVDVVYVPTSPTACDECRRLIDGRVFRRDDIEGATNYKRKQQAWRPAVPLHPNCTHFAIPASQWLIDKAKKEAGGSIPSAGVKVSYTPPVER